MENKTDVSVKTLVILAAGIGSRFGGGVKQLEPVGPNGELIIDYSIHDAIAAGFNQIIFIIRSDIEKDFREVIGDRIEKICCGLGVRVRYAFQEKPPYRKPWGTGHAVLACDGKIDGPFAVINADDYYGKSGFKKAAEFLGEGYGLVGYVLKNTLSESGGVTRGVCTVNDGKLAGIDETKNILSDGTADGRQLDLNSLVSMNFWCFPPEFMETLREGFPEFRKTATDKGEYLLPIIADGLLKEGVEFSVLPSEDSWFGVTYKEDKETVVQSFKALYESGAYGEELYGDL